MSAKEKGQTTTLDRPRVLTLEVQQLIVTMLGEGNFVTTACRAAGIDSDTFYYWRKLYQDGVEHAQVYADFFGACARASAISEVNANRGFHNGVMGWQGRAQWLSIRFPKRWSNRNQANPGMRAGFDPKTMSNEDLNEIVDS